MIEFDVAIIGGGPGGYVAALRAAQQGATVCLVEGDRVGGTCLNRGCIPTKALCSTAHLLARLRGAGEHGIDTGPVSFDFGRAAARKDAVVEKLVGGVEQLLKGNKVELFRGHGSLEGPGRVRIRRQDAVGHVRARNVILATGSVPLRPQTLGIDGKNILTSDEILAIKGLPSSLLIIGGGYIGCEFASIFSAFGSEVALVEQLPRLLTRSDRQSVREVEKALKEQGVAVHTGTAVESLEVGDGGVVARFGGETFSAEKVLVAVGRRPNSAGLGLEEAGVQLEDGAVVVDEGMRTSVPGIYAIGDVTGGIQLAHVASYQAEVAVENALGGSATADYGVVPSAVFTLPELAQVGLSEEECRARNLAVEVGRFAFQASSKALCDGEAQGSAKIVAEAQSGRILGASVVGPEASALIAEVAVAMRQDVSAAELGRVIHAHPTLPEIIKEAAEDVEGAAVHKVGRRKRNAPRHD